MAGRARTTRVLKVRFKAFKECPHRFHSLRQSGVNSRLMVRAAGAPAILYGAEAIGMASTMLQAARAAVAGAADGAEDLGAATRAAVAAVIPRFRG